MLANAPFAFLFIILALTVSLSLACSNLPSDLPGDLPGIGKCHHIENGEVLDEVKDANGVLFPVKKTTRLTISEEYKDFCGLSVRAELEGKKGWLSDTYVYHPETGHKIYAAFPSKGLLLLEGYEWY